MSFCLNVLIGIGDLVVCVRDILVKLSCFGRVEW